MGIDCAIDPETQEGTFHRNKQGIEPEIVTLLSVEFVNLKTLLFQGHDYYNETYQLDTKSEQAIWTALEKSILPSLENFFLSLASDNIFWGTQGAEVLLIRHPNLKKCIPENVDFQWNISEWGAAGLGGSPLELVLEHSDYKEDDLRRLLSIPRQIVSLHIHNEAPHDYEGAIENLPSKPEQYIRALGPVSHSLERLCFHSMSDGGCLTSGPSRMDFCSLVKLKQLITDIEWLFGSMSEHSAGLWNTFPQLTLSLEVLVVHTSDRCTRGMPKFQSKAPNNLSVFLGNKETFAPRLGQLGIDREIF